MSMKVVTITLKCQGRVLGTLDMERGGSPVMVGRLPSCALRAPSEDRTVSKEHAKLFWRRGPLFGGSLFVEDNNSRNGVYRNGERIEKPVKIKPGDVFTIGDCTLEATMPAKGCKSARPYHQLMVVSGLKKGKLFDVKPGTGENEEAFTIGSTPGSGIFIDDRNVSRHHAKLLLLSGGDCWIVDEGSRNGTYVEGEKVGAKKQLLKHGNIIKILHYEFRFIHKDEPPPPPPPWRYVLILLLLGIVGVGIWVFSIISGLDTEYYLNQANKEVAEERFDSALWYVEKAANDAKDGSLDGPKMQIDNMRAEINNWKKISEGWEEARTRLQEARIDAARAVLGSLMDPANAWTWSDAAKEKKKDATFAHELMKRYDGAREFYDNRISDVIRTGKMSSEEDRRPPSTILKSAIEGIDAYLASNEVRIAKTDYLAPLVKEFQNVRGKIGEVLRGVESVDAALGSISDEAPDFTAAAAEMLRVSEDTSLPDAVRKYAESFLPLCKDMVEAQKFLERQRALVSDMKFADAYRNKGKLPVPPSDECGRHPKFSDARATFMKRHESYLRAASSLSPMVDNLSKAGVRDGARGKLLDFVFSDEAWDKTLSFDCFQRPCPQSSRVAPISFYDELVGIECTYANLKELPKLAGRQALSTMNFKPKCWIAKETAFMQIRMFIMFMDRKENGEFLSGKLGGLYALGTKILADRDRLVRKLKERAKAATSQREKIIAGYYAEYFADEYSYAEMRNVESAFKKLEEEVRRPADGLDIEQDPEKRIELRKKILDIGIPGNHIVRRCWLQRDAE